MTRWRGVWAMARKNLRKAWLRNTILVLALTLAIAGDLLLGLFFTGLEGRAAALVPQTAQNASLLALAPPGIKVESWLSWGRYGGGIYRSRTYDEAYTIHWQQGATSAGRTYVMAIDPDMPFLRDVEIAGRWPFEPNEVALPEQMAAALAVAPGDRVQLAIAQQPGVGDYLVSGVFKPEAAAPDQGGGRRPVRGSGGEPARWYDQSIAFPMLYLYDTATGEPRWPINGAYISVSANRAATLERRLRGFLEREAPTQPALARFALSEPIFLRADLGPTHGHALGRLVFSPGRRAIGASFLFIGIGIFVILLIAFIERKRELAVLKTVGMNNNMVLVMVLAELGTVALIALGLGSAVAVGVGRVIAQSVAYIPPPNLAAWLWAILHTAVVLVLATLLPLSMMRLATVQQLLQNERLYIWRKRVTLS